MEYIVSLLQWRREVTNMIFGYEDKCKRREEVKHVKRIVL